MVQFLGVSSLSARALKYISALLSGLLYTSAPFLSTYGVLFFFFVLFCVFCSTFLNFC